MKASSFQSHSLKAFVGTLCTSVFSLYNDKIDLKKKKKLNWKKV